MQTWHVLIVTYLSCAICIAHVCIAHLHHRFRHQSRLTTPMGYAIGPIRTTHMLHTVIIMCDGWIHPTRDGNAGGYTHVYVWSGADWRGTTCTYMEQSRAHTCSSRVRMHQVFMCHMPIMRMARECSCRHTCTCTVTQAGPGVQISLFHLSELFPTRKSTVLSIVTGAFQLGFIVFLLFRMVSTQYDITLQHICWAYCVPLATLVCVGIIIWPDRPLIAEDDGEWKMCMYW